MTEPAELQKRLELLQGISIFFTLPDSDMRRLARKLRPRHVASGEEVVKQGDVADRMHIIVSGRFEVSETWAPHHSVTVAVLGPGDFFGLSAMKGGTPQAASVTSIEQCELLELLTDDIDAVLTEDSPVRAEVERLVERSGAPITERLGLAADVGDDELRRLVTSSVERWRRRAEHPLAPRDTVDAASVVLRTYEGILLELEPAPVG